MPEVRVLSGAPLLISFEASAIGGGVRVRADGRLPIAGHSVPYEKFVDIWEVSGKEGRWMLNEEKWCD